MVNTDRYFKRKSSKSTLKLYLILSFLVLFLFSTFKINQINVDNNVFPCLSSSEIVIPSPENRTFRSPMTGYFPGSYGFENYKDGTTGSDIGFINEYYGLGSGLNTDIRIIEELLDGHYNYLYIRDSQSENNTWGVHYIDNPQSVGTIEFFNRFNNDPYGSALRRQYIYFRASDDTIAFRMQINHHNGDLMYYNGSSYELISNVNANTWYHHRIIFNCDDGTMGKFTWIIRQEDGTEIDRVSNIDFENVFTGNRIEEIYFETEEGDYELESMWDAFGFSWDSNYIIGENLKEGLLLSFENTTALDWIGYSLDGNPNRTILGNTSIPLPENGIHSIQIFGTHSNGTNYESDVRFFSVNINNVGRAELDIPVIPIIIVLSAVGISVPLSYIVINYEKKHQILKKIKHKKEVGIKPTLKRKTDKERYKLKEIQTREEKLDVEALSPISQEILSDDIEKSNLAMLKELCNEWINQCAMHKESFEGLGYSCYNCHTKYCVKCAYTLAEKNIGCIVCGKLIPIIFQKNELSSDEVESTENLQNIKYRLQNIFESENLLEKINQFNEIDLTFLEKDFFKEIEKLELNENEKQVFIKEMLSLTPNERKDLINKMINEPTTTKISINEFNEIISDVKSRPLKEIFKSENVLEKINQFNEIILTFFEKDFFDKIEKLELDQNEKQAFIKDMLSLTPEERNQIITKLRRYKE
ncbi:MAG: hypothetical protein ACFFA0_11515 [Promethearchaeota archaeon]